MQSKDYAQGLALPMAISLVSFTSKKVACIRKSQPEGKTEEHKDSVLWSVLSKSGIQHETSLGSNVNSGIGTFKL